MFTVTFSAICAFLMRVSMSEIGSLILINSPLPACLDYTRNFTAHCIFTQFCATQTEFAEHTTWATGQGAAIAQAHRTGITRQCLQFLSRSVQLFLTHLYVRNDRLQFGTLNGILL